MRREDDRFFFLFFFLPFFPSCCPHARRGAAGRPWPRMRAPAAAPGSAREDLPPKEGRKKKKKRGKIIGNETRGNEFSLVATPGSRGKLGSGKEAPTPKKAVPEGRPGLSPIPIPSPFPARFLSLLPRPIPFLWDKPPGKELPKPDSSIPRTASVRALHIPYIPAAHRHAHTLPAAPSYSTTIYFTVYIPH